MKTVAITAAAQHMLAAATAEMNTILTAGKPLPDGRIEIELEDDTIARLQQLDPDPSAAIVKLVMQRDDQP